MRENENNGEKMITMTGYCFFKIIFNNFLKSLISFLKIKIQFINK